MVGVAGTGLLVGYSSIHKHSRFVKTKPASAASTERRQVVGEHLILIQVIGALHMIVAVVLGGDHPLALPLILDLEKKGYIIITTVPAAELVETVESRCHGYVRALVLDPDEVRITVIIHIMLF